MEVLLAQIDAATVGAVRLDQDPMRAELADGARKPRRAQRAVDLRVPLVDTDARDEAELVVESFANRRVARAQAPLPISVLDVGPCRDLVALARVEQGGIGRERPGCKPVHRQAAEAEVRIEA